MALILDFPQISQLLSNLSNIIGILKILRNPIFYVKTFLKNESKDEENEEERCWGGISLIENVIYFFIV